MSGIVHTTNITIDPITKQEVLPCPFCGRRAKVGEVERYNTAYTVICEYDEDGQCYGYGSLVSFSRRSDAIAGWNKRA